MPFIRILSITIVIGALVSGCATRFTPEQVSLHIKAAELLYTNGDPVRADKALQTVASRYPNSGEVNLAIANAYFANGAYLKADKFFGKAYKLGQDVKAILGRGRIALRRNRVREARHIFDHLLQYHPGNIEAINGLGVAHDLEGQHREAQAAYRQVLEVDSSHTGANNNLALSYAFSGNLQQAHNIQLELLQSNPENRIIRHTLAVIQAMKGHEIQSLELASYDMDKDKITRNINILREIQR